MSDFLKIVKGTVEDTFDPELRARVRVRLDGYHTQMDESGDIYGITTDELTWFPVMMPTTSSSRAGVGTSPSGLLIGDRVLVLITDEFIQSGLVVGTIHGDGDISDLSMGGAYGLTNDSVNRRNSNISKAPMLYSGEYDRDEIEVEDVGFDMFFRALEFDEGFRDKPYYDKYRYPTIGIGTLLIRQANYPLNKTWSIVERKLGKKVPSRRLSYEEAKQMALSDIEKFRREIQRFPQLALAYNSVNQTRKYGLLMMCYQMGTAGVAGFKVSLNDIINEDWDRAFVNLKKSAWNNQTPLRANRVATVIRDGNFSVYPASVRNKAKRTRSILPMNNSLDFEDLSEFQIYVINRTKKLREFKTVRSIDDIQELLKDIMDYRAFMSELKASMEKAKEAVKSVGDISVMEFVRRYIDSFKRTIKRIVDSVIKFITDKASEVIEGIKATAQMIKTLGREIVHRITDVTNDIVNIINSKKDDPATPIEETEESGILFTEPPAEYAGEYPHVKTEVSPSGHVREIDDTPGFERIREEHCSGTFREVNYSGRLTEKTMDDRYIIIQGDDHLFIEGSGKITIGGNHIINILGDSTQIINGDVKQVVRGEAYTEVNGNSEVVNLSDSNIRTEGDTNVLCKGMMIAKVEGAVTLEAEDTVDARVKGKTTLIMEDDVYAHTSAHMHLKVDGSLTTEVEGDWYNDVHGNVSIISGGNVNIHGNRIDMRRS